MNFSKFMLLLQGLVDDLTVQDYDYEDLTVYVTRSSGELIFGVMNKEQEIIGYFKWEATL